MKTLFLSTTVLTVGLLTANANAASAPQITIGGVANAQIAIVNQDLDTSENGGFAGFDIYDQDVIFRNDNEIHFSIDGKTDGGLEYGAVIQLEADVGDEQNGSPNADRTYVYLQGAKWGRVELGSNNTASDTLKLDADTFARGTGGIGGDAVYYTNTRFSYMHPGLITNKFFRSKDGEEANKITYYTPKFAGFQAGISYIPEYNNVGQLIEGDSYWGNIISLGVKYEGEYKDFKFAIAGVSDIGDNDISNRGDIKEWNVGANISYAGFTIGGSYADFGDSIASEDNDSGYYTAGISYANDQFGVGVGYFASELKDDDNINQEFDYKNIVISADYNLAPGIMPYAEISIFDNSSSVASFENEGNIVLIGTELTF